MVSIFLSGKQFGLRGVFNSPSKVAVVILGGLLLFSSCRSSSEGTYRGTLSHRVIEFRSGSAYITEGGSTQAVVYELADDKVILKMPFMDVALQRMPDGSLSGMGETLVRIDKPTRN